MNISKMESSPLANAVTPPDTNHPAKISIVAPCYNEVQCIAPFFAAFEEVLAGLPNYTAEFVFVNDGSTDGSLEELVRCQKEDPRIVIVDLSRNFGKEAALTAALEAADGDVMIPVDMDLQDPPELIPEMLQKWREGYDVVLAHRQSRKEDSFFKRRCAHFFYRIHNRFAEQRIPEDVGDFRLMDRKVVEALKRMPETCRFMKGIFAWLGFKTAVVDYSRPARVAGKSKFKAWKLWNFALDGITSFSTVPLRIWSYIGLLFALLAFIYGGYIFFRTIFLGIDVPGYASMLVAIIFFGGLQLLGIGIIGEYLGRVYLESKRRPIYLIKKIYRIK